MKQSRYLATVALLALLLASGCQDDSTSTVRTPPQATVNSSAAQKLTTAQDTEGAATEPVRPAVEETVAKTVKTEAAETSASTATKTPPTPPVSEDFQGEPQLSLFPRAGDFRPADDDERLPFWATFIDHLTRMTGVAEDKTSGNRAWLFRAIDTIDSVGYFAPLAVEPSTTYEVSFKLNTELPDAASAGIGILEFDEFLWLPEQYTEATFKEHFRASQEGLRLTGTVKGSHAFSFTTGPDTGMIHLTLFRDGPQDNKGLLFDDIKIAPAGKP
jgi:hypothetical protein